MLLFNKNRDLIGIDIGSSSLKLMQLKEQKGAYQLLNVGLVPLPPEAIVDNTLMDSASIASAIKGLVASLGVKIKDAACSVSGNSVIIRKISVPAMPVGQLEDQITWEAEQYIPFDINDVNIDFQVLSDSGDQSRMDVLLVASKKDIINDYAAVFSESGLRLSVVDVDSFAVQNAFEVNHEAGPEEVLALINIGASVMNINIVKEGVSLFTRDAQMGGNLYTEEIQKQLGVSRDEAESMKLLARETLHAPLLGVLANVNETITQEVRRSLDFYNSTASEERIARVFLSGGCSKVCNLRETIGDKLGLSVEMLNPFLKLRYNEKDFDPEYLQEIAPLMAVTVGLAIRRVGDK
ncbi:type IV pilus biogenesis protein PilM [Geobacter sp. SVR]|uniref:type IV pilus biogenesis protein PilM n=1 Tax=Geobacter sp. SVR TaxID=2495594 RepID=UPI00143F0160|nr:type IV pilus assembly protein PilM [Geobacter sp. SVR]BCS53488.1 pilus assembly protein PilM [Geobacter sp. SVR]GCF85385.1 pilus assembly protein PilM [Geobacter sp. SVR]